MLSKDISGTIFRIFGMTGPKTESRSPGPLVNTLPYRPVLYIYIYIYIYILSHLKNESVKTLSLVLYLKYVILLCIFVLIY